MLSIKLGTYDLLSKRPSDLLSKRPSQSWPSSLQYVIHHEWLRQITSMCNIAWEDLQ